MSLTGEKSRFAIEYTVDRQHRDGLWFLGRFVIWIGGTSIGSQDHPTNLREAMSGIEGLLRDQNNHKNPRFWNRPPQEVFDLLDNGLYGSRDLVVPKTLPEDEQWARHDVTPNTYIIEGVKLFLVDGPEYARLIWGKSDGTDVREVTLKPGEFDLVVANAYGELETLHRGS